MRFWSKLHYPGHAWTYTSQHSTELSNAYQTQLYTTHEKNERDVFLTESIKQSNHRPLAHRFMASLFYCIIIYYVEASGGYYVTYTVLSTINSIKQQGINTFIVWLFNLVQFDWVGLRYRFELYEILNYIVCTARKMEKSPFLVNESMTTIEGNETDRPNWNLISRREDESKLRNRTKFFAFASSLKYKENLFFCAKQNNWWGNEWI